MTKKWFTRSRWRFFSLVVVLVIVTSSVSIWMGFARHDSSKAATLTRNASASTVQPAERVAATGTVIASRTAGVHFCLSISDLMFNEPPSCTVGVRVVGVDFSRLAFRSTVKGVRSGNAYLAGFLGDGTLHVTKQGPPRYANDSPDLRRPPCATPSGGWIDSTVNPPTDAVNQYRSRHRWDLTGDAFFRPTADSVVEVLASTHPARTDRELGPSYPRQLCVIRSRYTKSQVNDALALVMKMNAHRFAIYSFGHSVGPHGQQQIVVSTLMDTPALRAALSSAPAGLIHIDPWLKRLGG